RRERGPCSACMRTKRALMQDLETEEMSQHQRLHVGREDRACAVEQIRRVGDEYRSVIGAVRESSVLAAHQSCVERSDVHRIAETEHFSRELQADAQLRYGDLRIDEELDRVIAGLPVNIDGARILRRAIVVEPVIVREPAIWPRDQDELTGARMVEAGRALL